MQLLLVGYYGYNNLGDELLAKAAARIIAEIPAQVKVLTPKLRKPLSLVNALVNADGLVFGGGSLFQDITGRGLTVLYYVGIAGLGLLLRKKLFFIGQGMGPIRRPINRLLLRFILQRSAFISLRNRESLAFVQALGITKARLANDLLFANVLPVFKQQARKKIKIVLSFRTGITREQMFQLCVQLQRYELVVVIMQQGADERFCAGLKKYARVIGYHPEQIMREIATADLAVGMRLHFLILAAAYTVPFIGIAYDPKVEGLCKHWHMPYVANTDIDNIPALISRELAKSEHYRTKLRMQLERERSLSQKHVQVIQEAVRHACQ